MKLIIYGIGDFAKLMQYYFESETEYQVVAFCVDKKYISNATYNNVPVISFEDISKTHPSTDCHMFIAIGYKSMRSRSSIFRKVKDKKYHLASFLSKHAHYDDSNTIGENCILLQGSILEPFARVDDNSFINTGVIICHHAHIKSHCFIAAGSLVGGYSVIGFNCFIGFRASLAQKLRLADETLLGAHSLCLSNTQKHSMYIGAPAKLISTHEDLGIRIVDESE